MPGISRTGAVHRFAAKVAGMISSRAWKVLLFAYHFVDRTILILGFISLCTGIIAYGRFFVSPSDPSIVVRPEPSANNHCQEGHQIFTGLAHWIKGGVFFWLGLLTLGRWAGSFGDLGWVSRSSETSYLSIFGRTC